MRILKLGPGTLPIPPVGWGGIEKIVWQLAVQLRSFGHEVDIFNTADVRALAAHLACHQYDVIHAYTDWPLDYLAGCGRRWAFTSNQSEWTYNRRVFDLGYSRCDIAICVNEMVYDALPHHRNKFIVHNAACPDIYKPLPKIPGKCVALGRNEPRKRFKEVAALFTGGLKGRLRSALGLPAMAADCHLLIIGPGAECFRHEGLVDVLPNSSDEVVSQHLGEAEYFFHLSHYEAEALAVHEASMSG